MFQQSLVTGEVPAEGLQVLDPGGLSARLPDREAQGTAGFSV